MPNLESNVQIKRKREKMERKSNVDVSSKLRATNDRNAINPWHFRAWQICGDTTGNRPGVECRRLAGDETVACSP